MKFAKLLTLAVLSCIVLAGCDKKVHVTFVNDTNQTVEVNLTGPGEGTGYIGAVSPGSKLPTRIKVKDDYLNANYRWSAGRFGNTFTITKQTPKHMWINISNGIFRDRHTEIQKTRTTTRTVEHTEEVIVP